MGKNDLEFVAGGGLIARRSFLKSGLASSAVLTAALTSRGARGEPTIGDGLPGRSLAGLARPVGVSGQASSLPRLRAPLRGSPSRRESRGGQRFDSATSRGARAPP